MNALRLWSTLALLGLALAPASCVREPGGQGGARAGSQDAGQAPPPFRAVVEHVDDGDTFSVTGGDRTFRIRLSGVDAPEIGQQSGVESRNRLRTLIFNRTVECGRSVSISTAACSPAPSSDGEERVRDDGGGRMGLALSPGTRATRGWPRSSGRRARPGAACGATRTRGRRGNAARRNAGAGLRPEDCLELSNHVGELAGEGIPPPRVSRRRRSRSRGRTVAHPPAAR